MPLNRSTSAVEEEEEEKVEEVTPIPVTSSKETTQSQNFIGTFRDADLEVQVPLVQVIEGHFL